MLDVTNEDMDALQGLIQQNGCGVPNVKLSIYKNRRGKYNKCYLWMYADKSTCRFNGLFCTDYNYEPIQIQELVLQVQ